jgi:TetR/AcrR family transcriptional regulator
MPKQTRRSPAAEDRILDAERSRAALLNAARVEFSTNGFAGTRVAEIANRAGLNAQLITYYFGGKAGLYSELQKQWLEVEARFADPQLSLADLTVRYLESALDDPSWVRLQLWDGLAREGEHLPEATGEDLSEIERRQESGELAAGLDPGVFLVMMMGAVIAPLALPSEVTRVTGMDPQSQEFRAHYAEHLRRMIRLLAEPPAAESAGS